MSRESGFYWVLKSGLWIVAEWDNKIDSWFLPGRSTEVSDGNLSEIDERKIERL